MASSPRRTAAYFTLQGLAVLSWWVLLLLLPDFRPWFFPAGELKGPLLLFGPADALVLAPTSLAAGWLIARAAPQARLSAWLATGAALYAAGVTVGWAVLQIDAPLASPILMVLLACASVFHARQVV